MPYDLAVVKFREQPAFTNFPFSDYEQEFKQRNSITMEGLFEQLHMQGKRSGKGGNQNPSMYRSVNKKEATCRAQIRKVRWRILLCMDANKIVTRDACAVYMGFMLLRSLWPDVVYVCFHPFRNSCCTSRSRIRSDNVLT